MARYLIDCLPESPGDSTVGDKILVVQVLSGVFVECEGNDRGGLQLVDEIVTAAHLLSEAVVAGGTKMRKDRTLWAG